MDLNEFNQSLSSTIPPRQLSPLLEALWHDKKGNWDRAHEIADMEGGDIGFEIHAYLHRKEGDEWNAKFWYKKAGIEMPAISITEEWELLVNKCLK